MKILQIFGAVIAVHLLAFIFIFATPGCQSSPANRPTPDATVPTGGTVSTMGGGGVAYTPTPVDTGATTYAPPPAAGRAEPTRPGSPNAAVLAPSRPVVDDVAPVTTYTVQRGDSLWSIAKKHKITVAELARANNLATGATLKPGQKLMVPTKPAAPRDLGTGVAPAEKSEVATTATTRPASGEAVRHTVQPGESLGTIARKYQVTVGELAAANNITDPAKIRAGQQLVIPGFRAVNARPATASQPAQPAAETPKASPRFEVAPPPPGQDLDAGLQDTTTDVPTIKVEDPRPKG